MRPVPIVGRYAQWRALVDAYSDHAVTTVAITGEAGIGKSRLVDELVAATSAPVVRVGCFQLAQEPMAYSSLYRVLEALCGAIDLTGRDPAGSGLSARLRQFDRWIDGLVDVAGKGRALFVVEDLHWGDVSTLAFLVYLARVRASEHLLTVLTWRDDSPSPSQREVDEVLRCAGTRHIPLARLGPAETAELAALIGQDRAAGPIDDDLLRRSEGNPYLLGELIAGAGCLPDHVQELLLLRRQGLTDDANDLVRLTAVAGPCVDDLTLSDATGWDLPRYLLALRSLLATGLVVRSGDTYCFRHSLAREAVLARLLPGERRAAHAAVACALERRGTTPTTSGAIALHWDAARDRAKTLSSALRAASDAFSANAFNESWSHYKRFLDANGDPVALDLLAEAGEAAVLAGDLSSAVWLAEQGAERADSAVSQAAFLERLGRYLWASGRGVDSSTALERAAGLLEGQDAPELTAAVTCALARNLMVASRYPEAAKHALEALGLARQVGSRRVEAEAMINLGFSRAVQGDESGNDLIREALALALALNERESICRAYSNLVFALNYTGRTTEATDAAAEGLRYVAAHGLEVGLSAMFVSNAVAALIERARFDDVRQLLDDVLSDARQGLPGTLWLDHARVALIQGDVVTARGSFEQADKLGIREDLWVLTEAALVQARLLQAEENPEQSQALLLHAANDLLGVHEPGLLTQLCRVGLELEADAAGRRPETSHGRTSTPVSAFLQCLPERPGTSSPASTRANWLVAHAESGRAGNLNDPGVWDEAVTLWKQADRPYEIAYCRYRQSEALAHRRQLKAASAVAAEARTLAEGIGAGALTRRISDLQVRARLTRTRPQDRVAALPPSPTRLTTREGDVLVRLAGGATNKEIAKDLYISERTAEVHVAKVLRKLGAPNRIRAAAMYHENRIAR